MLKEIPIDCSVICPWCLTSNTIECWNNTSYSSCVTREQRRSFKNLTNPKVWGNESKHFFKCPNCNRWIRGNKLRIDTNDAELSKLGGKPLMEVGNGHKLDFNP